jgi:hypothetical protein
MMQSFVELSNPEPDYGLIIDEDNLVNQVAQLIRVFQRQQDRISDMVDGMQKIAEAINPMVEVVKMVNTSGCGPFICGFDSHPHPIFSID